MRALASTIILGAALVASTNLALASDDPRHLLPSIAPGLTAQSAPCDAAPARQLALADLVDLALCRNPATAVAWASVRSAAANTGIARAAELPNVTVNIGPTISRTDQFSRQTFITGVVGGGVTGGGIPGQTFSSSLNSTDIGSSANLALSYLLFDFGGRAARINSARANQRAALASFADTAQTVALNTVTAYNNLQGFRASVVASNASVLFAHQSLDNAAARERAGVATPADRLQAETALAQAQLTLQQAEGSARTAGGQLAVTVGLPPTIVLDLAAVPPLASAERLTGDVRTLISEAERLRPDLASRRASLDAAQASARAARSDARPSVELNASDGVNYANSINDRNSGSVGLSFVVPLFNGYDRAYRRAAAQAEVERNVALVEQTRQQAGLDVFTNATALDTQIRVLATARVLINSATASANIAQGRFAAGVGTFTDLLNAQSALANARQQVVSADFGVRNAQAQLARSVGSIGAAVDELRGTR